ncbi:MAG: YbhB/YbcL family Raf kinase inhibitor-like protein [Chitinophagaceae bacterium]|nr:YbhB/YbcL family Raf kinase inhibitor-like protein [Chitinophagaceae bacterium]
MVSQLKGKLTVTSTAFKEGDAIPSEFIYQNMNPPLNIAYIPEDTKAICIIIEAPGVAGRVYDKWMAWNINPVKDSELSFPFMMGRNATCPIMYAMSSLSSEPYRYYFYVYALGEQVSLKQDLSNTELQNIIRQYIIADGSLMGIYEEVNVMV